MANYSKEAKRQNEVLKDLISGKQHEKSYVQVGYEGKKEDKGGETRKSELTDIMAEARVPLFCPKCKKTMKKKLDNKFWYLYKHCFDCQIDFENKLRLEGKYKEWETEKVKKNQRAWVDDMIVGIEEWRNERPVDQIYDVGIDAPEVKIEKAQVNEEALNKLADDAIKDLKKMRENI
jgi:ribosomal protein L37AE/L43A